MHNPGTITNTHVLIENENDSITITGTYDVTGDTVNTLGIHFSDESGAWVLYSNSVSDAAHWTWGGGNWSVTISDWSLLDGDYDIDLVTVDDMGSNETADPAGVELTIATTGVTLDAFEGSGEDGYINASELASPLNLSGTVKGVEDGQTVSVTISDSGSESVTAEAMVIGGQWALYQPYAYTETQVKAVGYQNDPDVAGLADGGHVVVWEDLDGDAVGILLQRYSNNNVAIGGEEQVNTYTTDAQYDPVVTTLTDGSFVVVWASLGQDSAGNGGSGIYMQHYAASGGAVGAETLVNSTTTGMQFLADIAALSNGGFVVSWTSSSQDGSGNGVYLQQYDSNLQKVGGEIQANTHALEDQYYSSVAGLNDGGYVVVWESYLQDGDEGGVYLQRYDATGVAVGSEIQVNTETTEGQGSPDVTSLTDGGFVVSWTSLYQDGFNEGVYLQRYDSNGQLVGTEQQVNTSTQSYQSQVDITALADGGYVATWNSAHTDDESDIYLQRYDASGNPVGSEILVNTDIVYNQFTPSIDALADGGFIVTWLTTTSDASVTGVYSQRFDANGDTSGVVDNTVDISAFAEGPLQIDVSVMDEIGNEATLQNTTLVVDTSVSITLDTTTPELIDGYVNGVEAQQTNFSGTVAGVEDGQTVQVTVTDGDNNSVTGSALVNGGQWSLEASSISHTETMIAPQSFSQEDLVLTALPDGGFVAAWESYGKDDGDSNGVYFQRYDFLGNTVGAETLVNTTILESQDFPTITTLKDGSLVIAWESNEQDGDSEGIYLQQFDVEGNPQGVETQVNTHTDDHQTEPVITALADGGFVVAWNSYDQDQYGGYGVYFQQFDANGNTVGSEQLVNDITQRSQYRTDITALSDGGFIITWQSKTLATSDFEINMQRYDASGNPSTNDDIQVSDSSYGKQFRPEVTELVNNGFVVVWQGEDADQGGIFLRMFDAAGNKINTEIQVNTHTTSMQEDPIVTALADGGFIVAWNSYLQDGEAYGIYYQRYDSLGNTVGSETLVNTTTAGSQDEPSIVALADGGFIIGWDSAGSLYYQRFAADGSRTDTLNGAVNLEGLLDGPLQIDAQVQDRAGNEAIVQNTFLALDTTAVITLDAFTGNGADGYINKTERLTMLPVSGTVSGIEDNQAVTITVSDGNNTNTDTVVVSGGSFSGSIDFTDLDDGTLQVSVESADQQGNVAIAQSSLALSSSDFMTAPTVNAVVSDHRHPWLSGVFDADNTQTLTITVEGATYTLGVDSNLIQHINDPNVWVLKPTGNNTYTVGQHDVQVTVTDHNGFSTSDVSTGELTINPVLQAPRVSSNTTSNLTPSIGGYYDESNTDTLTVEFLGQTYQLGVDAELVDIGQNRWKFTVDTPLNHLTDYDVIVTATDSEGFSQQDSTTYELHISGPESFDPTVNENRTVNFKPVISGFIDSDYLQDLSVTVDGTSYTLGSSPELVLRADNSNSWILSTGNAMSYGSHDVAVSYTDTLGQTKTDSTVDELHIYQERFVGAGDSVVTQGGDDLFFVGSDDYLSIDGGAGEDLAMLNVSDISFDFSRISNVEKFALGGENQSLSVTLDDVLAVEGDTMTVFSAGNNLLSSVGEGWTANGTTTADMKFFGITYTGDMNVYESGGATLLVEQGLTVDIS